MAQALVGVLDWGMSPQQAVAMGHVLSRNGPAELEAGTEAAALEAPLDGARPEGAGQGAQQRPARDRHRPGGLVSGVDPRREGAARGE